MGLSWAVLGLSWGCLGAVLGFLGLSWALLGLSWALLGLSWAILGLSWGFLGLSWGSLGLSWGCLVLSWAFLGLSWAVSGLLGAVLGLLELLREPTPLKNYCSRLFSGIRVLDRESQHSLGSSQQPEQPTASNLWPRSAAGVASASRSGRAAFRQHAKPYSDSFQSMEATGASGDSRSRIS